MTFQLFSLLANAVFLVLALALSVLMLQAGVEHKKNYGDTPVQERLKWKILRAMLALMVIALLAAAVNLANSLLG